MLQSRILTVQVLFLKYIENSIFRGISHYNLVSICILLPVRSYVILVGYYDGWGLYIPG